MGRACWRIFFHSNETLWRSVPDAWAGRMEKLGAIFIRTDKVIEALKHTPEVTIESVLAELISHEFIHGILEREFGFLTSKEWDYWGNGHDSSAKVFVAEIEWDFSKKKEVR